MPYEISETRVEQQPAEGKFAIEPLADDIIRVLETDPEAALITKNREPWFANRLQTALQDRFDWNVTPNIIENVVNEHVDSKTIRACVGLHTR